MSVWVVCWLQSYDGPIFEAVFATEQQAKIYVEDRREAAELYSIEEYKLD